MGIPLPTPASQAPPAGDAANAVVTGNFTSAIAAPSTAYFSVYGVFNFAVWGTFVATIVLEKSYDGGTTWIPVFSAFSGAAFAFTGPGSILVGEPERQVAYRAHCTQYVSGTASYRLSTNGLMAQAAGVSTI